MTVGGKKSFNPKWTWLIIPIILLFIFVLRFHLLSIPLERDEGEYAYAGQLFLQGILPYDWIYPNKIGGIWAIYAAIMAVFGQTPIGIHLGLMIVNMITTVLIFLMAKRLMNLPAAIAASTCFAVLSVNLFMHGIIANAEHFIILSAVAGILIMLIAMDTNKLSHFFWSGFCLGISFLMKQQGAFFIAFTGLYLLFNEVRKRPFSFKSSVAKLIVFSVGVFIPFSVVCLILKQIGVFEKFWFWNFAYSREYISTVPLAMGVQTFMLNMTRIVSRSIFLWLLALIGFGAVCIDKKSRAHAVFFYSFGIFSFLSIIPGFFFRPHYFLLLIPAASLFYGSAIQLLTDLPSSPKFRIYLPSIILIVSLFHSVYMQREMLFEADPATVSHAIYGGKPFPEAIEIAKYIRENSAAGDPIAILGSEPEILFYAQRRSATSHVYMYPLTKNTPYALDMQKECIREIEATHPEFLIFVGIDTSWFEYPVSKNSASAMLKWFDEYKKKFDLVGVIGITEPSLLSEYHWGKEVDKAFIEPRAFYQIYVFKRMT